MNQYPSSQDPWGRPADPQQEGYGQYPGQGEDAPPRAQPQYPPPVYQRGGMSSYGGQTWQAANPQQRRIFTIGAVVAAILAFVLVVKPFGSAGFAGTWVGPNTQQAQQGTSVLAAELLLNLSQSGNNVTGTGQECFNTTSGAVSEHFDVTGTANGSSVRMTWKSSSDSQPVSGTLANGTLTVTAPDRSEASTVSLQQGTLTQFTQACSRLIQLNPNG